MLRALLDDPNNDVVDAVREAGLRFAHLRNRDRQSVEVVVLLAALASYLKALINPLVVNTIVPSKRSDTFSPMTKSAINTHPAR